MGGKQAEMRKNRAIRQAARLKSANAADALAAAAVGGAVGADGADAGGASVPGAPAEPPRKVKARMWYINPRYFVDVVKYRVHLLLD